VEFSGRGSGFALLYSVETGSRVHCHPFIGYCGLVPPEYSSRYMKTTGRFLVSRPKVHEAVQGTNFNQTQQAYYFWNNIQSNMF